MQPKEIMNQISDTMGYAQSTKPDSFGAFMNFNSEVLKPGKLSTKTKELIAIALSLSSACEWCITFHVRKALEFKATEEEIMEAANVAVLMAGAPALMNVAILKSALAEFK